MANYYSTCRTNYFKVKNEKKFRDWAKSLCAENLEVIGKEGIVGLLFDNGIPDMRRNPKAKGIRLTHAALTTDEQIECDFFKELKGHLKKGEVAIYMEAGAEKHRYVTGYAIAVSPEFPDVGVNLMEIYELAAEKFGKFEKEITKAEY